MKIDVTDLPTFSQPIVGNVYAINGGYGRRAGHSMVLIAITQKESALLWREPEWFVAKRIRGAHGVGWCTPDGYQIFRATHWMPLPPRPIDTSNGERDGKRPGNTGNAQRVCADAEN